MLKSPDLPPTLVKPGSTPWPFGSPPGVTGGPTDPARTDLPILQPNGTTTVNGVVQTTASTTGTTATQVHQALVAILIMGAFVYLMTLLAGTSPAAGKIIVTLFIGLLLIQGATHVNPFVEWVNKHPLQPTS
jgi:hypothetical protein